MKLPAAPHQRRDMVMTLALSAGWCAWLLWLRWDLPPPDINALYFAARFFNAGSLPEVYAYDLVIFSGEVSPRWREAAGIAGYDAGSPLFPYVYPPLWAGLLGSLAGKLTLAGFSNAIYAVQLPLICASGMLTWRIYRPEAPLWLWQAVLLVLTTISIVGLQAIWQNQPQITLAFLVVLAFERAASDRPVQAGAALAIAAAIKLYPALFALIWLLGGNRRAVASFAGFGAALAALSLALGGAALHWEFLAQVGRISEVVVASRFNFNLEATLFQLTHLPAQQTLAAPGLSGLIAAEPVWITWTVRLVLITGVLALALRGRNASELWRSRALTPALIALASICSPIGWGHHFLPMLMFLPGLAMLWGPRAGTLMVIGFAMLTTKPVLDFLNLVPGPVMLGQLSGAAAMILALLAFALAPGRLSQSALR